MAEPSTKGLARLPAEGCRSYHSGRCLYEEQLNPGLHEDLRCLVQTRWVAAYDDFLNRAENFGLEEGELGRLWRARFVRLTEEDADCPDFEPALVDAMPECRHLFVDLCLLRLPPCPGRCKHYRLHTKA